MSRDLTLEIGGQVVSPGDPIGPYVFQRLLGTGGMARVLLAVDPAGKKVALKVLRKSRFKTGLARFRREFHALSRINHANVVGVDAYGDLHGHPYIAMEFVDGPDLHQVIRSMRDMPDARRWARCEAILIDLCRALAAIHERGLVHRDLKPSNVLLTHQGTCKLTDFGIVKDLDPRRDPHLSTTLVGTWAYTSPEHISGRPVDHRSDLYSLGVILFAMLTGKRPFVAESMGGYLHLHRDTPAPAPSTVRPGVPDHLDEVCRRLLEKAPRDRFQSAAEVLYRLEVDDALEAGHATTQWVPPLVGSPEPAERLAEAVSALTARRGGVVRILGDDGFGKTRLLDVVTARARLLGLPCHRLEFTPDAPVFARAVELARELLRELPEAHQSELNRIVQAFAEGSALRGDTRYALYDSVRGGLEVLLDERPRILLLDDLHEAKPPEVHLVSYVVRALIAAAELPLLVVMAERQTPAADHRDRPTTGDLGVDPLVLHLQPLTVADVRALVGSLVSHPRSADVLAERLHQETEGNPFFATEFLRSLIAQNLLARTDEGYRLTLAPDELVKGHLEIPPGIRQLVQGRLAAVLPSDRPLLDVLAVHGQDLDLDVLLEVLQADDEQPTLEALDRLIFTGLVAERRQHASLSYKLTHRKIGDVLLRGMDSDATKAVHKSLAEALQDQSLSDPEALAVVGEHFRKAGMAGQAYCNLVGAARRLVERSLAAEAWAISERARELEPAASKDLPPDDFRDARLDQLRVRGTVYYTDGSWSHAEEAYAELLQLAEEAENWREATNARLDLATSLRRQRRHAESFTVANDALELARKLNYRRGIAEALHCTAALSWAQGDLAKCEALATEGLLVAKGTQLAQQRARLLLSLTTAQATRGQLGRATKGLQEAEGLFDDLRMKRPRVLALANLAELMVWQGDLINARDTADRAHHVAHELRYALGGIAATRARGVAQVELGHYWEGQTDLIAALALAEDIDVVEEVLACRVALTQVALERQDFTGARRHAAAGLRAANDRDPEAYLPLLNAHLARALGSHREDLARPLLQSVEAGLDKLHLPRRTQVRVSVAWAWLALGQRDRVREHAEAITKASDTRAFRLMTLEARALLAHVSNGDEGRRHLQAARTMARDFALALPQPTSELVLRRPVFRGLMPLDAG